MVDANQKDGALKSELSSGKDAIEKDEGPLDSLNNKEVEDGDEDEYEEDDDDEEDEEEEEEEEDDEEVEEEKVNDGGNAGAEDNVKEDEKKAEEPKSDKKSGENLKSKEKRPRNRDRKKNEQKDSGTLAVNGDKPESWRKKKASKRVESMGMVFMCSSKTKSDCFRYKILGLPENKKDQVLKIYQGMRLFLFDIDLRLMYGIFKAAGPGGYNIEPKAFKSEFPSQVRFTVLDDCLPLAEENFKSILKENYYSRNKFEGLLKSDQVKNLCKLFLERSGGRTKSKRRRTRPIETRRTRLDDRHRSRRDDQHTSRSQERRRRRDRNEERRSRSPLPREKRRHTDYDRPAVTYDREPPVSRYGLPVTYDRELPVSRYGPPQPTAMGSPVRLYAYERQPLDGSPYIREHVPEPLSYRVVDRERDPYLAYSREAPLYHDRVYTVPAPPEYHLVSREYPHPSAVQAPEYRIPGGTRVPDYRDLDIARDYRSAAAALPDYLSRTHYKY